MFPPSQVTFNKIIATYQNPVFLKQGGQKVVFRIDHPRFGPAVLKLGIYNSPQGLERISREVKLLQEIDSKYYPKNFAFTVHENLVFEVIEELVEGTPLSEQLDRFSKKEACELIRSLTIGLSVIWERNTVHRDLKPDNILVTSENEIKIIDLGIARQLDLQSLTHTLQARGPCTAFYAAPEQLSNRKTEISPRTDQFNLGILFAQLLLRGGHPFDPERVGSGDSIVDNILLGKWDDSFLGQNPEPNLKVVVRRLLGVEPYQRYRNATMLLADLDLLLAEIKKNGNLPSVGT